MVFVTTANAEKGLTAVPYKTLSSDMRKAVEGVQTNIKDKDVLSGSETEEKKPAEKPADSDAPKVDFSNWTNINGKTIKAMPLSVDITEVTFRLPNGKSVNYPLVKLSQKSREKLKEYFDTE